MHSATIKGSNFIGPANKIFLKTDFDLLLDCAGAKSKLCAGCNVSEFEKILMPRLDKRQPKDVIMNVSLNASSKTFKVRRSVNCQFLLFSPNNKTMRCQFCSKLNISADICKLKISTGVKGHQEEKENQQPNLSVETVNWKFLSSEQKVERYLDQKRRRVNAERREKYAKKIEEEKKMPKLSEQDSCDVHTMFSQLDSEMKASDDCESGLENDFFTGQYKGMRFKQEKDYGIQGKNIKNGITTVVSCNS